MKLLRLWWCVIVVVLLGACFSSSGTSGGGGDLPPNNPPPNNPPPNNPPPNNPPDEGCTDELPARLTFTPETADEAKVVGHLSGCTNGSVTTIQVGSLSGVPWTIDRPSLSWSEMPLRPDVALLRSMVSQGLIMAPGESSRVNAPPDAIHLSLDPAAVSAWHAIRTVAAPLEKYGQKAAVEMLAQGQPARRAAVQCGVSGAGFGSTLASATATEGQGLALDDQLGLTKDALGAGKTCITAIRQAHDELARQARPEWNNAVPLATADVISEAAAERPALNEALATAAQGVKKGSVVALKLMH